MPHAGQTAIIISASSDIGAALARRWLSRGLNVHGTFRTPSDASRSLAESGAKLTACDLADRASIRAACDAIKREAGRWDALVFAAGTTTPIGPFVETDFDAWHESFDVNFTNTMRVLHALLPMRNSADNRSTPPKLPGTGLPGAAVPGAAVPGAAVPGAAVLFFAGGGTNNAVRNYSAYTAAKIALIKATELLHAEIPDTRFVIVGPGWVDTKIHRETLDAASNAGENLARTRATLDDPARLTPMERVLDCCDWALDADRGVVGGRNFSVAHDPWGSTALDAALRNDDNMYKLRRHGNTWKPG